LLENSDLPLCAERSGHGIPPNGAESFTCVTTFDRDVGFAVAAAADDQNRRKGVLLMLSSERHPTEVDFHAATLKKAMAHRPRFGLKIFWLPEQICVHVS
jgi:hypothetical protein